MFLQSSCNNPCIWHDGKPVRTLCRRVTRLVIRRCGVSDLLPQAEDALKTSLLCTYTIYFRKFRQPRLWGTTERGMSEQHFCVHCARSFDRKHGLWTATGFKRDLLASVSACLQEVVLQGVVGGHGVQQSGKRVCMYFLQCAEKNGLKSKDTRIRPPSEPHPVENTLLFLPEYAVPLVAGH